MTQTAVFSQQIQQHYAPPRLGDAILSALAAAGKDTDNLTLEDLAPLDEFHIRGRQATMELAQQLNLRPDHRVLDVGSGLGGPSRHLAAAYGCQVTGLDLTDEFCQAAQMLAERLGLGDRVTYRQGSALEMPFDAASFDVVWTQHTQMNIADKPRLYREIRRVLKPGGLLAMYDILAGPVGPVHFPVPWARVPEHSFLITPQALRGLLPQCGLHIRSWEDVTEQGRAIFNEIFARLQKNGPPPLSYRVFLGEEFQRMIENTTRILNEERITVVQAVCEAV